MKRTWTRQEDLRPLIAWITVLVGASLLIYILMVPSILGVADNGDFNRVMGASGIAYANPHESYADRYFAYIHRDYAYGGFTSGGYVSTHVLLVALASGIGRLFNSHLFDIRILGALYMLLLLTAFAILVRYAPSIGSRRTSAALAALLAVLLLFVFGDVGYTAYFQSFFGEPYALVGMLLSAAAVMGLVHARQPSAWLFAVFIAAAIAVATSKIQNAPLGFIFALLAWRMLPLRQDRFWKRRVWTGGGLLLMASALMIVAAPDQLRHINLYQSIFYGALKDSPDVKQDMRELGIPEKYAGLAGTNFFQKNTIIPQTDPILRQEVLEHLSHRDILFFYMKHPARFITKLEKAAVNGNAIRPYYLGTSVPAAGYERGKLSSAFSAWSHWKKNQMPHTLAWFTLCYGLYYAALAVCWIRSRSRRKRLIAETLAAIGAAGIFACLVSIIGDGEADLGKHLFMFNVSFDMMVVSALIGAVYGAVTWIHARWGKEERGTSIDARHVHHN